MPNNRHHFPDRNPEIRKKDFFEVTDIPPLNTVLAEAERCLQCKHAPCIKGCPVNVQIPLFIDALKRGKFQEAYEIIRTDHFLPSVCGRVCPQENQCEKVCVLAHQKKPVAIGKLEKFVGDYALEKGFNKPIPVHLTGKRAAIIGAGPASLACAGELIKNGVQPEVFEALHEVGGVLTYGIPEFRLPKSIVKNEISLLSRMGVIFHTDIVVGKTVTLEELQQEFDALFIGSGAGFPAFLGIPGETLAGVFSANEFLTRINLMNAYLFPEHDTPILKGENVTVVGGGNTAMDAARTALRLGASSVTIIYRRTAEELPARAEEVEHAKEEGVRFRFLVGPTELSPDGLGRVHEMKVELMDLGAPDLKGRRSPVPQGKYETLLTDMVIIAIGTHANPILADSHPGLKTTPKGYLLVDKNLETTLPGVFAGGDIITGAATVIEALGAGKRAAKSILKMLAQDK